MKVTLKDNSDEVLEAFKKQVADGLLAIGETAEGYAKENCPVDTGRLRGSISNKVQSDGVYIGTNVEYAAVVEFGNATHKVGQSHFLRDAATTHDAEYEKIMDAALR